MAYAITVPFQVKHDSGAQGGGFREGAPRDGPWAEVTFQCLWDDRYQLCLDLIGTWTTNGSFVIRQPAMQYPPAPQMFCTEIVDIQPLGKSIIPRGLGLPWLSRQIAIVTARFTIPLYTQDGSDQSGQAYTTLKASPAAEFLTIPDTTYWFADGTPMTAPFGIIIAQCEYVWQRHRMPFIPDTEMALLAGKVNSDYFAISRRFVAAPGTVLFMPGTSEPVGNIQSMFIAEYGFMLSYIIEYKFLWRSIPWNYFFHPNRTSGFQAVTDGNGNPPYGAVAFTGALP